MLMYSNEFDIAGLVWSAGMFHFSGEGVHKLAEITPHFRSREAEKPGELMSFRPVPPGLLNRLISKNYPKTSSIRSAIVLGVAVCLSCAAVVNVEDDKFLAPGKLTCKPSHNIFIISKPPSAMNYYYTR